MRKLTLQEFQERLNLVHPNEQLLAIQYNGNGQECIVQCLTCRTIYKKTGGNFLDKRKVSICKKCFPTQSNIFKENYKPTNTEYELIGPYQGMQNKTLIKHKKCGFIWSVKPNNLEFGKGCPRCNKKVSKGEQKIINYLNSKNIKFDFQKKISIEEHNLFCDFYLPDFDLYIEYNGEQHYNPVAFFGGEEKYKKQIYNDNLKLNFLKEQLLVISYLDYDKIESILESSTTIPKGSRLQANGNRSGKSLEEEKDIV